MLYTESYCIVVFHVGTYVHITK